MGWVCELVGERMIKCKMEKERTIEKDREAVSEREIVTFVLLRETKCVWTLYKRKTTNFLVTFLRAYSLNSNT